MAKWASFIFLTSELQWDARNKVWNKVQPAGLVLEVNLLWQEVKYCGDEKWWHYITGHFLLRYSYRVLQSHQGSLVYFRANNRAHTRTPGVQPLEAWDVLQWSGGHRATVSRRHSSLWSFLCGELYVSEVWHVLLFLFRVIQVRLLYAKCNKHVYI